MRLLAFLLSLICTIDSALDAFHAEKDDSVNADSGGVENEEQEVLEVVHADAVGDPAAVVVHADHAPPARAAMVRPRRLHTVAMHAVVQKLASQVVDLVFA
mmetsp:Transcript_19406/g.26255  ORF Transcript_19406/g.26255 Transcript_19406/m.26255 type:complete len:101 (-) Transcript_19406:1649-1951(-)